jgi:hypothetical protein
MNVSDGPSTGERSIQHHHGGLDRGGEPRRDATPRHKTICNSQRLDVGPSANQETLKAVSAPEARSRLRAVLLDASGLSRRARRGALRASSSSSILTARWTAAFCFVVGGVSVAGDPYV